MSVNTYIMMRHGLTDWNSMRLRQGQADIPLNEEGRKQAFAMRAKIEQFELNRVFASDLKRARETALIINNEMMRPIAFDARLRERSWGSYEGKSKEIFEIEMKERIAEFDTLPEKKKWGYKFAPDIESNEELFNRLHNFLIETNPRYSNERILLLCHEDVMRVALFYMGWAKTAELSSGTFHHGARVEFEFDGTHFNLLAAEGITRQAAPETHE